MAEDDKALKLAANHGPSWWKSELKRSRKDWHTYREHGREVVKRYRDERDSATSTERTVKKFNILYSNTETLAPAVYSQVPVPDIRRRWADKDPVGRVSALVLQRATQYCIESYDFDGVLAACTTDYLLPGFAVARLQYRPLIKRTAQKGEDGAEVLDDKGQPAYDEKMVYQEANAEYTPWDRFLMSRSRTYDRVWWVAFGDDLTKDEVTEKFGQEVADKIPYDRREKDEEDEKEEGQGKARIWEVWCKRGRGRFFLCDGFDEWVGKPEPDPLRLENFFPNAKPLWAISTNETLKPKPEYLEYQDQALELDDLTERIDVLTSALRRRGVYDAAFQTMAGMLISTNDNQFVPVENWTAFTDKGGLAKLALEMPLDGLITAIQALTERREVVKQTVYEITGISDIVRGSSNPNETATAQNIKGRWAGLRISVRQKRFANFARDLVRLKAELIAERFDAQTLSLMTGVQLPYAEQKQQWQMAQQAQQQQAQMMGQQYQQAAQAAKAQGMQPPPPPPQPPQPKPEEIKFYEQPTWEEVIQVLRDDKMRGFKIDIETDSTVQPDADAEKQARTELLTSVADFAQRTGIHIPAQLGAQMIQFATRSYKVGSQMEQELEALEQNPGPTPQQQQKEKELQQREVKVKQVEDGAKDAQHQAQMATKDSQAAAKDVEHRQEIMDLEAQYQAKFEALQKQFMSDMQNLVGHAEGTVRQIIKDNEGLSGGGSYPGAVQ